MLGKLGFLETKLGKSLNPLAKSQYFTGRIGSFSGLTYVKGLQIRHSDWMANMQPSLRYIYSSKPAGRTAFCEESNFCLITVIFHSRHRATIHAI